MKRLLIALALASVAGSALAADLSVKAPRGGAILAAPGPAWAGFYGGVSAGWVGSDLSVLDVNGGVVPGPFDYSVNGFSVGAQAGYNWAVSNLFLVGLEGQLGYIGNSGGGVIGSANAAAHQDLRIGSGLFADITARAGVTLGPVLIYGKGGFAWFDGRASQTTTNPGYVTTPTATFDGWTAGAGVEYLITQHVSVKGEYQFYDFGSQGGFQTNVGDPSSPAGYNFNNTTSLKVNTVKAGLNYHF